MKHRKKKAQLDQKLLVTVMGYLANAVNPGHARANASAPVEDDIIFMTDGVQVVTENITLNPPAYAPGMEPDTPAPGIARSASTQSKVAQSQKQTRTALSATPGSNKPSITTKRGSMDSDIGSQSDEASSRFQQTTRASEFTLLVERVATLEESVASLVEQIKSERKSQEETRAKTGEVEMVKKVDHLYAFMCCFMVLLGWVALRS